MKDKIVQEVIKEFQQRSEVGIKKYGTTLEDNNNDDFLTHLQQELMDAILYIQKLKSLQKDKNPCPHCGENDVEASINRKLFTCGNCGECV